LITGHTDRHGAADMVLVVTRLQMINENFPTALCSAERVQKPS